LSPPKIAARTITNRIKPRTVTTVVGDALHPLGMSEPSHPPPPPPPPELDQLLSLELDHPPPPLLLELDHPPPPPLL